MFGESIRFSTCLGLTETSEAKRLTGGSALSNGAPWSKGTLFQLEMTIPNLKASNHVF